MRTLANHDLSRDWPACAQWPRPLAEPHWGLPTALLAELGDLFLPEWAMAAHLSWVASGQGAFRRGHVGPGYDPPRCDLPDAGARHLRLPRGSD